MFFHLLLNLHPLDVRAEFAQLFVEMLVAAIDVIDAADFRDPVGVKPASTNAAEARRSLAITGAPVNFSTPEMTAVGPSSCTCAPIRFSSATCM